MKSPFLPAFGFVFTMYFWAISTSGDKISPLPELLPDFTTVNIEQIDTEEDFSSFDDLFDLTVIPTVVNDVSCNQGNDGLAFANTFGGEPPYTYLWSNGETMSVAHDLFAGQYFGTVTDAVMTTRTFDLMITEPLAFVVSPTNILPSDCNTSNGVAQVMVSGGNGAYTYQWDNGATSNPAFNFAPGAHLVTITDATSCSLVWGFDITENNTLQVSSTTIVMEPDCNQSNGIASINHSGGTEPVSYLWDNGVMNNTAFNLDGGLHTGTITDANSCTATFEVTLTETTSLQVSTTMVNAEPDCNTNNGVASVSWSGGTPPSSFLWDTGATTNPAFNLGAGLHTGTITDANACTATFEVTLTENNTLQVSTTTVNAEPTCNSNNGVASVSWMGGVNPSNFLWDTGETNKPSFQSGSRNTYRNHHRRQYLYRHF